MVFRTAGNHFVAAVQEHFHHRFGVFGHLLLVGFELRLHRFFQRDRFRRDNVHQRAALRAREHGRVQFFVQLFAAAFGEDQTAARASQRFMSGRGDDVRVRNRVRVDACGNQARHVRHIDEQVCADAVSDFTHFCPVNDAGVRGETTDDHFRFVFFRLLRHVLVIDFAGLVDTVRNDVVELTGEVNRGAVGQVAALRQVHTKNGIARLQQRGIDREVGLGTGVRLHVSVVSAEEFFRAVNRQLLNDIHIFAAAVVALARITFGIFVGQLRALRLHHARAGVVFGGDQFDVLFLTYFFLLHSLPQFGIIIGNVHFTL
ncbi:FIG00053978: hypothetical protein [Cronobacter sakazakii 696]|nr:FIG00053978: hypothetical protein [Cronobacter sakazakii 696]